MKSPKTYIHRLQAKHEGLQSDRRGFTMIEILVTISILAILIGMGLFMSLDFYRHTLVNDERDLVVSLLLKARTQSIDNLDQLPHGVCFVAPNYVIFRGTACTATSSTSELTPKGGGINITGLTATSSVIFNQLSGDASTTSITLSQDSNVKVISINNEGRIDW